MKEQEISHLALKAAFYIHTQLGPGLLESAYKECLFHQLKKMGLRVEKEVPLPLIFEDVKLECGYRLDIMIERKFIIEVKSVENLNDVHLAQILTYLKLSNSKLGLLINFNTARLKNGIKRVINGHLD